MTPSANVRCLLEDAAVLAELTDQTIRPPDSHERSALRYTARVVGMGDHQLDVELSQNGATVHTWIALPESLRPMLWLVEWEPANDPRAWVRQLADWLDEEMYTGGLGSAYARIHIHSHPRLVVDGYGFRQADEVEHQRLRRSVGPHGWHATSSKRQITKQYAAEWALDEVEQQIQELSPADLTGADEHEWSPTSPEGPLVYVEACAETGAEHSIEVLLIAHIGPRGQVLGRRRISRSIPRV